MSGPNSEQDNSSENDDSNESSDGSSETGFFVCLICMRTARKPSVSFCGHVFCDSCQTRWIESQNGYSKCPYCQSRFGNNTVIPINQADVPHRGEYVECRPLAEHREFKDYAKSYNELPETGMNVCGILERPTEVMPRIRPLAPELLLERPNGPVRSTFLNVSLWQRSFTLIILLYLLYAVIISLY